MLRVLPPTSQETLNGLGFMTLPFVSHESARLRLWLGKGAGHRRGADSTRRKKLFPDVEGLEERLVALLVGLLEVVEQPAAFADHLEKAPVGMVVLLVADEVLVQPVDPLRQESDLDL